MRLPSGTYLFILDRVDNIFPCLVFYSMYFTCLSCLFHQLVILFIPTFSIVFRSNSFPDDFSIISVVFILLFLLHTVNFFLCLFSLPNILAILKRICQFFFLPKNINQQLINFCLRIKNVYNQKLPDSITNSQHKIRTVTSKKKNKNIKKLF